MHKLTYNGTVENGVLKIGKITRKRIAEEIKQFFNGKEVVVSFERKKIKRSLDQNAYYWGVVIPSIVKGLINLGWNDLTIGNEAHHYGIHEFLKKKFLDNGKIICDIHGVAIEIPPSTKILTKSEFMDYLDKIIRWSAEDLKTVIPPPE